MTKTVTQEMQEAFGRLTGPLYEDNKLLESRKDLEDRLWKVLPTHTKFLDGDGERMIKVRGVKARLSALPDKVLRMQVKKLEANPPKKKLYHSGARGKNEAVEVERLHEVANKDKKATVQVFLYVLKSKIVQADQAQMKRDLKRGMASNPYALGLMLDAASKVEKEVHGVLHKDDEESLRKLQKAIKNRFNDVSPVRYTVKAIDKYLATGKIPKISGKAGAAPAWK